jgi:hypothetical protein
MISLLFAGGFFALLLAGVFGAWVGFGLGLDHAAAEGRHRAGSPRPSALLELPRAGRLPMVADPFAVPVGAAEYRLMTDPFDGPPGRAERAAALNTPDWPRPDLTDEQRAILAEHDPDHPDLKETPSAFTRRMAATVDALVKGYEERGNYDRHLIQARR